MFAVKTRSKQAKELKEFEEKQLEEFNKRLAPFEMSKAEFKHLHPVQQKIVVTVTKLAEILKDINCHLENAFDENCREVPFRNAQRILKSCYKDFWKYTQDYSVYNFDVNYYSNYSHEILDFEIMDTTYFEIFLKCFYNYIEELKKLIYPFPSGCMFLIDKFEYIDDKYNDIEDRYYEIKPQIDNAKLKNQMYFYKQMDRNENLRR